MQFISWLTSQSGVSLLVALVALFGVVLTTWWNNQRADKRRIADQAAEDNRRRVDDDRRERERQEILWRDDLARQRAAVVKCIRAIRDAEIHLQNVIMEKAFADPATVVSDTFAQHVLEIHKATALADFFHVCMLASDELELELTQPKVRAWAVRLRKEIAIEYNAYDAEKQRGVGPWIEWANSNQPLSLDVQNYMNGLVTSAFEHLHPFPTPDGATAIYGNGIAGMPVTPKATRPGTRDHAEAERAGENKDDT